MPTDTLTRTRLAQHFQRLTAIERDQLFGAQEEKCRPLNLHGDAATMFSGYVGENYASKRGFLILAINPGGGGDAYTRRIPEDEVFYPLLSEFKRSQDAKCEVNFEKVNAAFRTVVMGWNLRRILQPTLEAAGATIDEVAYMNVVPYRTRKDRMPPVAVRRESWDKIVAPTIGLLVPRALITLGKKAGSVVSNLYDGELAHYCIPRIIGDVKVTEDARNVHRTMRHELKNV